MVALRNNERLFGDAALNTVSRRGRERERERERDTLAWLGTLYVVRKVFSCVHVGQGCQGSAKPSRKEVRNYDILISH